MAQDLRAPGRKVENTCLLPVLIEQLPDHGEEHALPRTGGSERESEEERAHDWMNTPLGERAWSPGFPQPMPQAMRQRVKQKAQFKHLQAVGEQAGAQPSPQQPLLNCATSADL
jgi:hypothetical protein